MKTIFLCICFLGAYVYSPDNLSGQESLLLKTIKGHSKIIYSVAFSPDGKYIASGGVDNTLKIWRLEDGLCVKTLKGHKSFVNSVAFSPDGKNLASASEDNTVKIWNIEDGSCINTFKGHRDSVWSAAFFPDGKRIASGSTDGTIKIWRVDSRTPDKTLKGHSGYVYSVSISSDGKHIASGSADHTIKIWDVESGGCVRTLEGHRDAVSSVAFSKTGNYLASGSDDGSVKIWRIKDGVCVKTFTGQQQPVLAVAYSPDGTYVFSGAGDNTVNAWHVSDGALTRTFKGHSGSVKSVALSPDGKYLASGSFDKTIKLWLTPWEADSRDKEMQTLDGIEAEKNKNYDIHYEAGLQLLSSPTMSNLKKSIAEFKQALSYKQNISCEEKLNEAVNSLNRKKQEIKRLAATGLEYLLCAFALLAVVWAVFKSKRNARLRKTLPDAIKNETLSGSYENAFKLYTEYKAIGGKPQNLPQQELLELYRGMRALDDLPKEDIPYYFLLSYAVKFVKEGNYKMAVNMLRSGRLSDEFVKPEDYDAFVAIYEEINRPETLLMLKLDPSTFSGLAEAFFKIKNYDCCEKMCGLKKQFYAAKISPRDTELLSACQKAIEEARVLKKDS
ncbi:MAG: WD40 repeat domain-containing protein [Elusimicrobia bacterium]|nr:WD40 repeat domain-containing protein [Elusimicrobiota bacterium]